MGYTNGKCSLKRASCKRSASVIGSLLVQDVSRWLEQERNSWSWPTALAEALQTQLQKCSWLFSPPSEPFPLWRKFLFPVVWMQQQFATTLFTFSAAVKAFFPPITMQTPLVGSDSTTWKPGGCGTSMGWCFLGGRDMVASWGHLSFLRLDPLSS